MESLDVVDGFPVIDRVTEAWGELAGEETDILRDMLGITAVEENIPPKLAAWMADVRAEHEKVRASTKALLARATRLSDMCEDLAATMDMRFLYDADRRQFGI